MGKAAPPHNKQCGERLFLYTMEFLETAGAKSFRESPGTLKALSYAGYFAAAGRPPGENVNVCSGCS